MTISDSSSLRFSPDMNLAYSARNKLFWLILGSATPLRPAPVAAPAFALPLTFGVGALPSGRDVRMAVKRLSGKKTAAQRSYSRQSNSDLANKYLLTSLASRAASSGSWFGENTGDMNSSSSWASSCCDSDSSSGRALSSSAALIWSDSVSWERFGLTSDLPFCRLVKTALRALDHGVLQR